VRSERLRLHSITVQMTGIVAISALLGVGLTATMFFVLFGSAASRSGPSATAARIASVMQLAQGARGQMERNIIIATARRAGIRVRQGPLADMSAAIDGADLPILLRCVERELESGWGIDAIESGSQLAIKLDEQTALMFDVDRELQWWPVLVAPFTLMLNIVLIFVLLVSLYAMRWIIGPLSALAAAAYAFGRSPNEDRVLEHTGTREIAQVTDALNDMQTRIRLLLDDRKRMLAAISHDLRAPLARLRLRIERAGSESKQSMLQDIQRMSAMLDETLEYLRDDLQSEATVRVDLPSLLQTICGEFADVGHAVHYKGPARLCWNCRPTALTRAVTNIVENAVKHASTTSVNLLVRDDGMAEIDVCDDGPGIPASLREKVFESFFKAPESCASKETSGFGLGLSIARDAVRSHGGEIHLLERVPHGLVVRIVLPNGAQS
jgi:signal transduction histidine kinase